MKVSTYKVRKYLFMSSEYGSVVLSQKKVKNDEQERQAEYLTSRETLRSQASLSLTDRCTLFEKDYPGRKLSYSRLRKIYVDNKVRLRILQKKITLGPAQLTRQTKCRKTIFPRILRLEQWKVQVVYVDEAVFTKRLNLQSVWSKPKEQGLTVNFHAVQFTCVAACVGVDSTGVVRAHTLEDFSIDSSFMKRCQDEIMSKIPQTKRH